MGGPITARQIVASSILMLLAVPPIAAVSGVQFEAGISLARIEVPSPTASSLEYHAQIIIRDNADFIQQGWEGTGSYSNPYVIENLNITLNGETCILIFNVSAHFVIRNSHLSTTGDYSNNIQIIISSNGIVDNCTITGGRYGVGVSSSSAITVANCTIYSTNMGIWLAYSDSCYLRRNRVYGTYRGIGVYASVDNAVISNRVYRAAGGGISMGYWSGNNRIFYNYVGWNGPDGYVNHSYNAFDYGTNNVWDDNISLGNFWWGYEGNGIYLIHGDGNAFDRYPTYFNDSQAPVIVSKADDLVYEYGDTNSHVVNWTVHDSHPYRYEIAWKGRVIQSEIWYQPSISLNVGGLGEGAHNFTVSFMDGSGNINVDTVIVYVILYILGDIGTDLVGYASIIAVFVVMSMIVLVRKRR